MTVATRAQTPPVLIRAVWCGVVLLAIIGVGAAVSRGVFPADFATRGDPFREHVLDVLHRDDPFARERAAELARFDGRFAAHPRLTLLHIVPGGVFLTLALLQFSSRVRSRYIEFHRWSGRVLLVVAVVTTAPALYFGVLMPYGGRREATAIVLFAGLFLVFLLRAYAAIRSRQVARHREWMIRAFAIAIGISTVRVVGAVLDLALTPAGLRPPEVFVLSVWTGWAITLGVAELWIRSTRHPAPCTTHLPRSTL